MVLFLLVDAVPLDHAGLDDVVKLEDDEAVGQVRVEPVDVGRDAERVHPVAVRLLLARLLDQVDALDAHRVRIGVQRRMVVEQVRHERQVQLHAAKQNKQTRKGFSVKHGKTRSRHFRMLQNPVKLDKIM